MGKREKNVDAYIMKSADFAQPILEHLRDIVHKACPGVEEKIKWGAPHFEYKGMMCGMAAFKQHCAFGFWKAALMEDKILMENAKSERAMGHLGRITTLKDLPSNKTLIGYIHEAMKLNEAGIKVEKRKPAAPKDLTMHACVLHQGAEQEQNSPAELQEIQSVGEKRVCGMAGRSEN